MWRWGFEPPEGQMEEGAELLFDDCDNLVPLSCLFEFMVFQVFVSWVNFVVDCVTLKDMFVHSEPTKTQVTCANLEKDDESVDRLYYHSFTLSYWWVLRDANILSVCCVIDSCIKIVTLRELLL